MKLKKPLTLRMTIRKLLFVVVIATFITACQNKPATPEAKPTTTIDTQSAPPCQLALYNLTLRVGDYWELRNAAGPAAVNKIVFQFVYTKNSSQPITLIAYSSRPPGKTYFSTNPPAFQHKFKYLSTDGPSGLAIRDSIILGDQQISVTTINDLLTAAGPTVNANSLLTFTPDYDLNGRNIRYFICVRNPVHCPAPGEPTQPSPPAN